MVRPANLGLMVLFGLGMGNVVAADPPPPLGSRITELALQQADGQPWNWTNSTRDAKAVAVVFLGTECPASNAYIPSLNRLAKKYADQGVLFVGLYANEQDDLASISRHAKDYKRGFLGLKDPNGEAAKKFAAERVPTAFVLDAARTVRYRGRIDDQYERGVMRPQATANELRDAVEAVLAGQEVKVSNTSVIGCPINFGEAAIQPKKPTTVTYSQQVARILQNHCVECHRPGEAAPFQLLNYKQAKAWSGAIREVVSEGIMPPWHADPKHGQFLNDRRLPEAEKKALLDWIDGGCPEGNSADLPPAKTFPNGWKIGQPDEVRSMNEPFAVPAQSPKGGVVYQYIYAGEVFTEDKWVVAAELRPTARAVVHHVIVFVLRPGQKVSLLKGEFNSTADAFGALFMTGRDLPQQLVGYAPGSNDWVAQPGEAKKIPKGSRLVMELHYTPNGQAVTDRTEVALKYAQGPPKHEIFVETAMNTYFRIPPKVSDYKVEAEHRFRNDFMLTSLFPHMHLRGKSFEYKLITPDGKAEILLSVPKYDFNWQQGFVLAKPKLVPKRSRLVCTATYDNSEKNPFNPDPTKAVTWGDQTWEEMMIGFFEGYEVPAKAKP